MIGRPLQGTRKPAEKRKWKEESHSDDEVTAEEIQRWKAKHAVEDAERRSENEQKAGTFSEKQRKNSCDSACETASSRDEKHKKNRAEISGDKHRKNNSEAERSGNEQQSKSQADGSGDNQQKKKFAWMDSDEDVSGGDSDEEEEELLPVRATSSTAKGPEQADVRKEFPSSGGVTDTSGIAGRPEKKEANNPLLWRDRQRSRSPSRGVSVATLQRSEEDRTPKSMVSSRDGDRLATPNPLMQGVQSLSTVRSVEGSAVAGSCAADQAAQVAELMKFAEQQQRMIEDMQAKMMASGMDPGMVMPQEQQQLLHGSLNPLMMTATQQQPSEHLMMMQGASLQQQLLQQQLLQQQQQQQQVVRGPSGRQDEERFLGRIKRYMEIPGGGGYGFIDCDDTKIRFARDVYIHAKQMAGFRVGDMVYFSITRNNKGEPQARDVTHQDDWGPNGKAPDGRDSEDRAGFDGNKRASPENLIHKMQPLGSHSASGQLMSEEEARKFQASLRKRK